MRELAVDEFNWRWKSAGKRQPTCRHCQHAQHRSWYTRNRDAHIAKMMENKRQNIDTCRRYVWQYLLAHPCVDCGEADPIVLEFDHVRGKKKAAVSTLIKEGYTLEVVVAEIDKCEVRCRNCHIRKHHREGGWYSGDRKSLE